MVPGNWHKLSPMYQPAVPFQENRPIRLVSSDTHRRTYIYTDTLTNTHIPVRRCRVACSHPSLLIVLRLAYGLPLHSCKTIIITSYGEKIKKFSFLLITSERVRVKRSSIYQNVSKFRTTND